MAEVGVDIAGVDERQEGPLRVGVGDDQGRVTYVTRGQRHACRLAVRDIDAVDRFADANIDAQVFASRLQRLRYRTHAADDVSLPRLLVGIATGQQVEQQTHRSAGLVGPTVLAIEAIGQDEPL